MRSPEQNQRILTVASMYLGYATFMMLRTAPITIGPDVVDAGLGIDKVIWSNILIAGTVGGIIGKFIMGWFADRLGGKFTFSLGLVIAIIAIAGFAVSSNAWLFGFAFFVALLAKSAGWPAMAKLIGNWIPSDQHGRVWGIIATSSRVGTIVATFCVGILLAWISWRLMLLVTAMVAGLSCLYIVLRLREHPITRIQEQEPEQPTQATAQRPHQLDETSLWTALKYFAMSRRFWLITGSLMGLTILWDFLVFVPFYLVEVLNIPKERTPMAVSLFPIGSLISVLIGGYVFDKLKGTALAISMGIMLVIATGCIGTFYLLPNWGLGVSTTTYTGLAVLFVFGFCVSPCYYLPMSIFSIRFGGAHSGMLISILDALGFTASAVFTFVGFRLVDNPEWGWDSFFKVLLMICAWSLVTTVLFLIGEARQKSD